MKHVPTILFWFLLTTLTVCWPTYAQLVGVETGKGMPPTRVFLPSDYKAHSQNFAFTQDKRGVLYVGNFAGVLEYDGLDWRTIPTQNITKVSTLLTGRNGLVYVGGNGEFGYLRPDSTGLLSFESLAQNAKIRFGAILSILEGNDGVYFVAQQAVFRWNGKTLNEWNVPTPIVSAFLHTNTLFVTQKQAGLCIFRDGRFTPLPDQKTRIDNVVAALSLSATQTLLVTRNQGLFQLNGNQLLPFASPMNAHLTTVEATGGVLLSDKTIAISTVHGEILILSPNGQLKQTIQEIGGLSGQLINNLYAGKEGSVWLAMNNGIAQLEIPSPITLFSESARQMGEVVAIRRVNNTLYFATLNGLFYSNGDRIQAVPNLNMGCFALAEANGSLFIATSNGVYQLRDNQLIRRTNTYSLALLASKRNPSQLYVGTETGLGILTISGPHASLLKVPGVTEQIFGIIEDGGGNLWLETLNAGLVKCTPATNSIVHYSMLQGLPTLLYNRLAYVDGKLLTYSEKGIFRYDAPLDKFIPYNPFNTKQPASHYWKNTLVEDNRGNIWTVEGNKFKITLYQRKGSDFQEITAPFLPLSNSPINVVYPDSKGLVWFGGRDGVIRYQTNVNRSYNKPYLTLIRRISTSGDKNLFNGYVSVSNPSDTLETEAAVLPYTSNDIRFEFSAATYPIRNELTFSYKLENYDDTWSEALSEQNTKEYTNLSAGTYTFRVKARNIYGVVGKEATYTFRVAAPWYGRWWVIGLLLIGAGLLIYWLVRWRLNLLVKEKEELENLIRERTEEVVYQKEELEKQSGELADKNDQLGKIDLIVQSINAEINFANLFQTILTKFSVIRNMDSGSFLVYEKASDSFRFKALRSNRDISHVESVQLTLEEAEARFLAQAEEVYEDIYRKDNVAYALLNNPVDDLIAPRSLITIVIKNEGRIEGFITLENQNRAHAFDQRDLSMIRNLKEHLIAAFIKNRLLEDLGNTLTDLKNTQDELIRQERLASVGQLTKGIVDRILNPLNYVTNFSQLSNRIVNDIIADMQEQKDVLPDTTFTNLLDDADALRLNLSKILEHSNSTTRILKDMQRLLREKSRSFLETDLNTFVETKARTALQEIKTNYKDFSIDLVFTLENNPVRANLLPHEFGQVIQDLLNNSYYALHKKSVTEKGFLPEIQIVTEKVNGRVNVRFRDNGKGIPQREMEKLFSPFFTTKPTGDGTGLGLFMIKDIVETHRGNIVVNSKEGEFTEVTVTLPTLN